MVVGLVVAKGAARTKYSNADKEEVEGRKEGRKQGRRCDLSSLIHIFLFLSLPLSSHILFFPDKRNEVPRTGGTVCNKP